MHIRSHSSVAIRFSAALLILASTAFLVGCPPTQPVITSITPVAAEEGQLVQIAGMHFGASQGTSTVTFNGAAAGTADSWTDAAIGIAVSVGAQSGPVTVKVGGITSNEVEFEVIPTPIYTPPLAQGMISAETGGTLTVNQPESYADGFTLVVPPGALNQDTVITIRNLIRGGPSYPDEQVPIGLPVQIEPEGLQFNVPVTIKMPFTPEIRRLANVLASPTDWSVDSFDRAAGLWNQYPISIVNENNGYLMLEIGHFSFWSLFSRDENPPAPYLATVDAVIDFVQNTWEAGAVSRDVVEVALKAKDLGDLTLGDSVGSALVGASLAVDVARGNYMQAMADFTKWAIPQLLPALAPIPGIGLFASLTIANGELWLRNQRILDDMAVNQQLEYYFQHSKAGRTHQEILDNYTHDDGWIKCYHQPERIECNYLYAPSIFSQYKPEDVYRMGPAVVEIRSTDYISILDAVKQRVHQSILAVLAGGNPRPSISIPFGEVVNPHAEVSFDGSISSASNGYVITEYRWKFDDGAPDQEGVTARRIFSDAKTVNVTLIVTDNAGRTGATTKRVIVTPRRLSNIAPTPIINYYNVSNSDSILFDAEASYDADGMIVSYEWSFGDGVLGSGRVVSHSYLLEGTYPVTLTITDNEFISANIVEYISVTQEPNLRPVANANGPYSAMAGNFVVFSSAGSTDPDGTIVSYFWEFGDGATSTAPGPAHAYLTEGQYTARLTVTDDDGATRSATATVNISPSDNLAPQVETNCPCYGAPSVPIQLSAAGTWDPEGEALTYRWEGPNGFFSTERDPIFTEVASGSYTVTLTVSDGLVSTVVQVLVQVVPGGNQPPVAVTNCPCSGNPGVAIALSAVGSHDPEGGPLTYLWESDIGQTATTRDAAFAWPATGDYIVTLTVTDSLGLFRSTSQPVTIRAPTNLPPIAQMSGPDAVTVGLRVQYSSAGSNDPEGGTLTYAWDFGDGTPGSAEPNPTHVFSGTGLYVVSLTVRDAQGVPATASMQVTASARPNLPPVAVLGGPYWGLVGGTVVFDGGNSYDEDGMIVSYLWEFGDTGSSTSALRNPSFVYTAPGQYTVRLTVTDDQGAQSSTLGVVRVGLEPVVAVNGPSTARAGDILRFSASVQDPSGQILRYLWRWYGATGGSVVLSDGPTLTDVIRFEQAPGTYFVNLCAFSSSGLYGCSGKYTEVKAKQPPVANANGPYVGQATLPVTFSATGSKDPDGQVIAYSWTFGDGGTGYGPTVTHAYSAAGAYVASLKVTDNEGMTGTGSAFVTISDPANLAPIARANGPYDGDFGAQVPFSSAGSIDPDGSIISYLWDFGDGGTSNLPNPAHAYEQIGSYTVTLRVMDDDGAQGLDTASVTIGGFGPRFVSAPRLHALVGIPYRYDYDGRAEATGGRPVFWSKTGGPLGMTIDEPTGLVSWTPDTVEKATIGIRPFNANGADDQTFEVDVQDPEGMPVILGFAEGEYGHIQDGSLRIDGDHFGYSVSGMGDVDGDSVPDYAVGAPYYTGPIFTQSYRERGRAYLISGASGAVIRTFAGVQQGGHFGVAVANVGDADGDGVPDVGIGQPDEGPASPGVVYVFSGQTGAELRRWIGESNSDRFGSAVGAAGDVDHDGVPDVIVGAPNRRSAQGFYVGKAYVYSGATGQLLYSWAGEDPRIDERVGWSVAGTGDVNRDGYADVIVGVPHLGWNAERGEARVYSGRDGSMIWRFAGMGNCDAPPYFCSRNHGYTVSGAGDIDGDGHDDVSVGDPNFGSSMQGGVFVYSGASGGVIRSMQGRNVGFGEPDGFGAAVANAGDVDGDSVPDILIARRFVADGLPDERAAQVFSGWSGLLILSAVDPARGGMNGAIAGIGDVNGDGRADVVAGYPAAEHCDPIPDGGCSSDGHQWRGRVAIFSYQAPCADGDDDGYGDPASPYCRELAADCDDSAGQIHPAASEVGGNGRDDNCDGRVDERLETLYRFDGEVAGAALGSGTRAFANVGDIDGDGADDLLIGAHLHRTGPGLGSGKIYLRSGASGAILIEEDGAQPESWFGWSVAGIGDSDDDGVPDFVVGAPHFLGPGGQGGRVYIYSGLTRTLRGTLDADAGSDGYGHHVTGVGDVDRDGVDDFLVGAPEASDPTREGKAYVYSGATLQRLYAMAGERPGDRFGQSAAAIRDIDGDGVQEIAVGAPYYDGPAGADSGRVYVFTGRNGRLLDALDGPNTSGLFGLSLAALGSLTEQSEGDLLVGAPNDVTIGNRKGKVFVFRGGDAVPIRVIDGEQLDSAFGWSVADAGDFDGDGEPDYFIGDPAFDGVGHNSGRAYVVSSVTGAAIHLVDGQAASDNMGGGVLGFSDLDGDGYSEFVVSAPVHDGPAGVDSGAVYVETLGTP